MYADISSAITQKSSLKPFPSQSRTKKKIKLRPS